METEKPKVAFYVKRPFGEKFIASFDFIKENWKLMLKYTTYLILPLCLLQALSLNGVMGYAMGMSGMAESGALYSESGLLLSFLSYYGLYMLLTIIGTVLLTALIYAMMRIYNEREERLQGMTFGMLRPMLFRNLKKLLKMALFALFLTLIVTSIIVAIAIFVPFTLFLFIPLMIAVVVPLYLWAPVYLFEDISLMSSLQKTFRLGFATWGGVFLITLIMGMLASILQGVTMIPWYIALMVKQIFAMSSGGSEVTVSTGYNFMLYLLGIVQAFGTYLAMIFTLVGWAYQYSHASEKVDSIMVENDIDNFDKL